MKGEFGEVFGPGKNLNVGKNKSTNKLLNNIPNTNLNSNEINKNTIEESRKNNDSNKFSNSNSSSSDRDKETEKMLERKESLSVGLPNTMTPNISPLRMIYMALIVVIILIIVLLFLYKDMVVDFFENIFGSTNKLDKAINSASAINSANAVNSANAAASTSQNTSAKVDNTSAKVDLTSAKVESTSAKIDDLDKKVDKLINTKTCPSGSTGSIGSTGPKESGINKLNNKLNNISPYKESNVSSDGYCYIGYDNGQRECVDVYAGDVCMSGQIFPSLDICINPKLRP